MTTIQTEGTEVSRYLAAIREALSDLSADERDELLEDLEAHLHEVVAESGTSLEASLGSPTEYAAELRASAGLDPAPVGAVPVLRRVERAVSSSTFWSTVAQVLEQPFARAARDFVPTLRPGWWVVRGWLWLFAVVFWLHNGQLAPYRQRIVVPTYHGHWSIGVLALAVAVVSSVWLGLRQPRLSRSFRRAIGLFSAVVVLVALSNYGSAENIASGGAYYGPFVTVAAPTVAATPYPGLTVNGRHPLNIYPYDREGHLLSGVRLFDDRGVPLQGLAKSAPGGAVVRVLPSDAAGALVGNEYPQQIGTIPRAQLGIDGLGGKVPTAPPAVASVFAQATPLPTPTIFVAPMAGATPTPTPSLVPSVAPASPSVSPTASPTPKPAAKAKAKPTGKPKPTSGR